MSENEIDETPVAGKFRRLEPVLDPLKVQKETVVIGRDNGAQTFIASSGYFSWQKRHRIIKFYNLPYPSDRQPILPSAVSAYLATLHPDTYEIYEGRIQATGGTCVSVRIRLD